MRKLIFITMVVSLVCSCGAQSDAQKDAQNSAQADAQNSARTIEELLTQYKTYHEQKDLEGTMSLFYQEDSPDFILKAHREERQKTFDYKITEAKIIEIPAETKKKIMEGFPYQGKTIVPNLEPIQQVEAIFDTTGQGKARVTGETIMIGKKGDTHYFVLTKFK